MKARSSAGKPQQSDQLLKNLLHFIFDVILKK
jgi:hypothetical protein